MNKLTVSLLALGLSAGLASAQEADHKEGHKDKKDGSTITGCLAGGEGASPEFVITEDGTSRRVMLSGTDLAKHANHKVKVTVQPVPGQSDRMEVTKVEHIADSCK